MNLSATSICIAIKTEFNSQNRYFFIVLKRWNIEHEGFGNEDF